MAQQLIVALIVLAAAAYATWSLVLRSRWRAREAARTGKPIDAGCGCSGCDAGKAKPGAPAG